MNKPTAPRKAPLKVGDIVQLKYDYAFYEWMTVDNDLVNPFISWFGKTPCPAMVGIKKGTICKLEEKRELDWNNKTVVFKFKSFNEDGREKMLLLCPSKDYLAYIRK